MQELRSASALHVGIALCSALSAVEGHPLLAHFILSSPLKFGALTASSGPTVGRSA